MRGLGGKEIKPALPIGEAGFFRARAESGLEKRLFAWGCTRHGKGHCPEAISTGPNRRELPKKEGMIGTRKRTRMTRPARTLKADLQLEAFPIYPRVLVKGGVAG